MGLASEGRGTMQDRASDGSGDTKDQAVWFGLELLEGLGPVEHASEAYQDLCLGLEVIQVKQVNELLQLILRGKDGG
jgi:hypothetical protein